MSNKHQRKRLYVDFEVQRALAQRVLLHWCIFFVVTFLAVGLLQALLERPVSSIGELVSYFFARNAVALVVGLALLPAFVYDTIKLSNRFAGPILRLRRAMRQASRGERVEPLKFRRDDFWGGLANEFNAVLEYCQTQAAQSWEARGEEDRPTPFRDETDTAAVCGGPR